ncbi:MAG: serine hydrolase [Proteobacteria bacterium]|nr:serine hydrolase [Pseudomonadota bacterium]
MAKEMLDGRTSDPVTMGWMQGNPPPPDRRILTARADHMRFPMIRWSYANMRQFLPTVRVAASGEGQPFPRALRNDLGDVRFVPSGQETPIRFEDSLVDAFTDGIIVLHRGAVVFERWFGVTGPEARHIAFSVTKSFIGTLVRLLIDEGRLDPSAHVRDILPELAQGGYGTARVAHVLDMTTGLDFSEDYADPSSGIGAYSAALGLTPRPNPYEGPRDLCAFLETVRPDGAHDVKFTYRTINTEVLAWIVARVEGKPLAQVLSERIWRPCGMLGDADLIVDEIGTPFAGGGLCLLLEDLARFGEAIRTGGLLPGAIAAIRAGGDPGKFDPARYPQLPGWSYGSQWWHAHDANGAFSARGIHGQTLWIDPAAQMVVARFASHPTAANGANDPLSLPAWRALADVLKL